MILVYAVVGLAVGTLLNWAADWLPRYATSRPRPRAPSSAGCFPAWWRLLANIVARQSQRSPRLRAGVAVELFTALLFAGLWLRFGPSLDLLLFALLSAFLMLIAVIDVRYRLVLNVLIYPGIALALLITFISPQADARLALLGGGMGLGMFALAALLRPGGLGGGDVKLAAFIGLLFGFPGALWALAIGILAGGVASAGLILSRRMGAKSQIPYAPFLCFGALLALFYNPLALLLVR